MDRYTSRIINDDGALKMVPANMVVHQCDPDKME